MAAVKDLALACDNTCHHFYGTLGSSTFSKKSSFKNCHILSICSTMFSHALISNMRTKLQYDLKIIDF